MAKSKKTTQVLRLMSQAGTGYFYTIRKSVKLLEKCVAPPHFYRCAGQGLGRGSEGGPLSLPHNALQTRQYHSPAPFDACKPCRLFNRLVLMKHDPVVNRHVLFKEERIKKKK